MSNNNLKLFKAHGEDQIDFERLLPARLVKLAIRRLNHKKIESIFFDFGLPQRLWLQSKPTEFVPATEFEYEVEFDVLTFKWVDRVIQDEKNIDFEPMTILKIERGVLEVEDINLKITVGMRIFCEGKEPVDILVGASLITLAIFGWGFPAADQSCEFSLDEYVFEPWF